MTATATATGVPGSFENTVGVQTLGFGWHLRWERDGRGGESYLGASSTKVYRVAATPLTGTLYETLLRLGCNSASGWTEGQPGPESPA